MKFSRYFYFHQAPEWSSYYVDYDGLKRRIKRAIGTALYGSDASRDRLELGSDINSSVERVDQFYSKIYTAIQGRRNSFRPLLESSHTVEWTGVDSKELNYLLIVLDEYRNDLKKLYYFGKLNADAVQRIVQKLHSYPQEATNSNPSEGEPKFQQALFYTQEECQDDLTCLESLIAGISRVIPNTPTSSTGHSLLLRILTAQHPSLSQSEDAYRAIREDDDSALDQYLRDLIPTFGVSDAALRSLLSIFLQISISWGSSSCLVKLLDWSHHGSSGTSNGAGFAHLLITETVERIGREQVLTNSQPQLAGVCQAATACDAASILKHVLDWLTPERHFLLYSSDLFRTALHHSAFYGLLDACQAILYKMEECEKNGSDNSPLTLLQDTAGDSPLELAVFGGHIAIVKILLDFNSASTHHVRRADQERLEMIIFRCFIFSLKSGSSDIVHLLRKTHQDNNTLGTFRRYTHPLYVAARSGNLDHFILLLSYGAPTDERERSDGWTPLFVAAIEGNLAVVDTLLHFGASLHNLDSMGWTALDHAAYRGHMKIVEMMREHAGGNLAAPDISSRPQRLVPHRREPLHRLFPTDENRILINLGSFSSPGKMIDLDLGDYFTTGGPTLNPEAELSIQISVPGTKGSQDDLKFPIPRNVTDRQWLFTTEDLSKVKLYFRIYHTYSNQLVGSGIAILEDIRKGLGPNRESLVRDYTIPLLSIDKLEYVGTLTFSWLIVTPFPHDARGLKVRDGLWDETGPTKVVGHRGRGMNVLAHNLLQIGENSLQSFLSAFTLGASWVELDVQVTKDHVPVVYHDFLVSETGTDAWIHNLDLKQLMHISETQSQPLQGRSERLAGVRPRSHSVGGDEDHRITDLKERFKHTYEYRFKQFKSNTRGDYIHEPFITLDELLAKLPESCPLNIEIKYPMLFETRDLFKADIFSIEINLFVDTILRRIFDQPTNHSRPIMFSSFSPEVCILVSLKQNTYPVFFLTDGGNWPTGDCRTGSLQEAVHFARHWNLDGVVTASEPLVRAPKLVSHMKSKGLVTASYGKLNNDPASAKIQADAGLDIIISDNVRLIVETLDGTRELPNSAS